MRRGDSRLALAKVEHSLQVLKGGMAGVRTAFQLLLKHIFGLFKEVAEDVFIVLLALLAFETGKFL